MDLRGYLWSVLGCWSQDGANGDHGESLECIGRILLLTQYDPVPGMSFGVLGVICGSEGSFRGLWVVVGSLEIVKSHSEG